MKWDPKFAKNGKISYKAANFEAHFLWWVKLLSVIAILLTFGKKLNTTTSGLIDAATCLVLVAFVHVVYIYYASLNAIKN